MNETLEQRVQAEAQERARIWNVSQDLLVVADLEGRFVAINPAWSTTLGWSEVDLLHKTVEWLLHPDDLAKTRIQRARIARGQNTQHLENRLRHMDGSYRWLSWRTATEKGYVYAVARDITDLKSAEEQLRISRHELAEVSRHTTMGVMAASIAHEVNQPLAAVITNANAGLRWLANTKPDLDEVRAILERIVNNGHRASAVVAGIRSMFRKDTGEMSPVNVNDLIREVLAIVRGELESHQVSLQTELHEGLQPVMAEPTQLQQVLLNLIMNAIDAMSAVTDRDRVLIVKSETGEPNHVAITVEDSGIGIQPQQMNRIFEAFFTTKTHGMGMGLSICRSIIESHGGTLSAAARSPHGSVFSAELPTIKSEHATL